MGIRTDWGIFWGAMAFLLVGGGFAVFGGYQLWTTRAFVGDAVPVAAVIVSNPDSCDDDGCTWKPVFRLPDGSERPVRYGASNYGWSEGHEMEVLSNPDFPYVRVPGADNLWLLGGGFFAIGMLPVLIAFWLLARFTFTRPTDIP